MIKKSSLPKNYLDNNKPENVYIEKETDPIGVKYENLEFHKSFDLKVNRYILYKEPPEEK